MYDVMTIEAALALSGSLGLVDDEMLEGLGADAQIEPASSKCHECLMADYRIGQHQHCGSCYCCKK